jgi:hypothetical protein
MAARRAGMRAVVLTTTMPGTVRRIRQRHRHRSRLHDSPSPRCCSNSGRAPTRLTIMTTENHAQDPSIAGRKQDHGRAPPETGRDPRERRRLPERVAFPNDFRPQHKAADLQAQYGEMDREALEAPTCRSWWPAA